MSLFLTLSMGLLAAVQGKMGKVYTKMFALFHVTLVMG